MNYTKEQIAYEAAGGGEIQILRDMLRQLLAENDALQAEIQEQCRIIGMSAERELSLRSEIDKLREDADRWKTFSEGAVEDWHDEMVNEMFCIPINPNRMNELVDAARKKNKP